MILLRQNTENTVVLTLTEMVTLDDYAFLFQMTNDTSGETKLFTAADISTATSRYNKFTIEETTSEDLYNGMVSLSPVGYWSYVIYQMHADSPANLDPADAVSVLEVGKVLVVAESETPDATFDEDDSIDNVIFE